MSQHYNKRKNQKFVAQNKHIFPHLNTKSLPYFVKFSSRIRPNSIGFSRLNRCKNVFSHSEKCGEIRYTGVKFVSMDEKWTNRTTKKKKIICETKIFIIFAMLFCYTAQACKITSDNDFGNFNYYNPHHYSFGVGF